MSKTPHLPEIMYGGLDTVANTLDEIGADATTLQLSCGIVNGLRAAARLQEQMRQLGPLPEHVATLDSHIARLLKLAESQAEIAQTTHDVHQATGRRIDAGEDLMRNLVKRIEELEATVLRLSGIKPGQFAS